MIEISSKNLRVGINPFGAELEYIKYYNTNVLWQRSSLWPEQSPILFPNIGSLLDNYFEYDDQIYHNLIHGFAKRTKFLVKKHTKTKVILTLAHNNETLKIYPFKFNLSIEYKIVNMTLAIKLKVENLNAYPMYFALGIHPGFAYEGLKKLLGEYTFKVLEKDYESIDFDQAYVQGTHLEKWGKMAFSDISKKLVKPRTLCYKDMQIIDLEGDRCSICIRHNMPYTAFWQKVPEGNPEFLCIEAWNGLPDQLGADHSLVNKSNLVKLKNKSIFKTYYNITYKTK